MKITLLQNIITRLVTIRLPFHITQSSLLLTSRSMTDLYRPTWVYRWFRRLDFLFVVENRLQPNHLHEYLFVKDDQTYQQYEKVCSAMTQQTLFAVS